MREDANEIALRAIDAENEPIRQIAEVDFARGSWRAPGLDVRVIVVRSLERHG